MSREDWQNNDLKKLHGSNYPEGVESILDIGIGVAAKCQYLDAKVRVGIDAHRPYLEKLQETNPDIVTICANALTINQLFLAKSFDLVICTDVIEHLEKDEALRLIKMMELIARKAVILETPKGYIPQSIDILKMNGDHWQTHRSGWMPSELERLGYTTFLRDYQMQDVQRHHEIKDIQTDIQLIEAIRLL